MVAPNRFDDFELTTADKQAWWEYIEKCHPKYYEKAIFYYSGEHDPRLEPDYVPQDMDINDYLVNFWNLPRISTNKQRNTITVNGIDAEKYLNNEDWRKKRLFFAKLKKTGAFMNWKTKQYDCQFGKCAWCKKAIDLHSPETHVDHIMPLLWYGTNEFRNLVLSCAVCNTDKAASIDGYHGAKGAFGENQMPDWIKFNPLTSYYDSRPDMIKAQVGAVALDSDDYHQNYSTDRSEPKSMNYNDTRPIDLSNIPF